MSKDINALHLHNYFSNIYKRSFGKDYDAQGKGLEMVLLKRLLLQYSPYQIMCAIERSVPDSIFVSIKTFAISAEEYIKEYADDPLLAKAHYAMVKAKKGKSASIRQAYSDYCDEVDAWAPSAQRIKNAATHLENLMDCVI